ncbi:MAG: S8 family serine peptidase, partial [Muribaculaceae bacterium]|nr:S8 family serine peptidase [Muribaculaceae bacterium]
MINFDNSHKNLSTFIIAIVAVVISMVLSSVACGTAYVDAISRLRVAESSVDSRRHLGVGGDEYEPSSDAAYIPAIICYNSDTDLEALREQGVIILRTRGGMALTYIPTQEILNIQRSSFISAMSVGAYNHIALDTAVTYFDARLLHQSTPMRTSYTGNGVVVGICDIGFDPLHPTFGTPDETRVARVVQYMEQQGGRLVIDGEAEYEEWKTDNIEEWHGTHVAGILTGDGAGTPYIGLAPDATLIATVSQLSDVGLLAGTEDVLEYARLNDKPAVVNLSMGNYLGPHDGTSLFSQYMALLGEEGIICMSSGNEGDSSNTLSVTFDSDLKSAAWRLNNMTWSNFDMYGMTDIWCADERPVCLRLGVCDGDDSKRIVAWSPDFILHDGEIYS